jgi:hypothetical protein
MEMRGTITVLLSTRIRIRAVIARNILFSGLDSKERDIIIDAMEPKDFPEVSCSLPCMFVR